VGRRAAGSELLASSDPYDQRAFRPKEFFLSILAGDASDLIMGSSEIQFQSLSTKPLVQLIPQ
jgi:hypothetical protein